ncbi:hypothetical protein VNO78_15049 [Psophocarpus tetragonolobus]|uniref:Pyrrolo-quinoline quinone repeat domain-containing protein n=1 Tax=Psophocarpus tetragonolobus TaxID=3891 RepID=A0AAN9SEC8_PSOTE
MSKDLGGHMQGPQPKQVSRTNSIPLSKYDMKILLTLLLFCVDAVVIFAASSYGHRKQSQDWLNHGGDLFNRRYASKEYKISPKTAPNLRLKWKFFAGKDITATPAIYDGTLYFPSWNGNIYAVKEEDGSIVWQQNMQNLTGLNATGRIRNVNWTVSRATPTVVGDLLILGIYGPAAVVAVKRANGELVWKTTLDYHPAAIITMSGTYYERNFYVGISSLEESVPMKECCTFRGSLVKLNARSGAIYWKTYMLPDNNNKRGEYAGASVWGSSPSIDSKRNLVYIATGNLYSAPLRIRQCRERQINQSRPNQPGDECVEPDNHSNSVLAIDLTSGRIIWYRQLAGYDVWFLACNDPSIPNCPPQAEEPDVDFGEAPMMLTIHINRTKKDVVVAVQKSGVAWALDRNNGNLVWRTKAGPYGLVGGGSWGAATDKKRVYTNIVNFGRKNFTLAPSNMSTTAGGWVAMDANSGRIVWSTANPSNSTANGPVSVANEVVFAGSPDRNGSVYAMDGRSGKILWSYQTGGSVYGGFSISKGCIYVGNGYSVALGPIFGFTPGHFLFAFCLPPA